MKESTFLMTWAGMCAKNLNPISDRFYRHLFYTEDDPISLCCFLTCISDALKGCHRKKEHRPTLFSNYEGFSVYGKMIIKLISSFCCKSLSRSCCSVHAMLLSA